MQKRYFGPYIIFLLPLIALVLWFFAPSVSFQINGITDVTHLLGRLTGIIGMMLFAESLILSARLPVFEKWFYGLNKVYEKHAQIGEWGFYLMVLHPIFLVFAYTDLSFAGVLSFFSPGPYLAINLGQFALYLFILLVGLTLYFRPKYHIWKYTHKFMGLAFFLGGMHAFLIPSDISNFLPLRYYVLSVSIVAILAFLYRTVLGKYTVKKIAYEVIQVIDRGENITEVVLTPVKDRMYFAPGQFAFVSFQDNALGKESHPFSFSSDSEKPEISFTIKKLGDFTSKAQNLKPGTKAFIEGPFGKFSLVEARFKNQIWIAGGIGVTPFLSMAKSLKKETDYTIDMYYCVKNEDEAVHLTDLRNLEGKINLLPHFSEKDGFINIDLIRQKSGDLTEKSIFICAPVPMIRALRKQLLSMGIQKSQIHSEEFGL